MSVAADPAGQGKNSFESEDRIVLKVARAIGLTQAGINRALYKPLASIFERKRGGQPWLYFNYVYVFAIWTPVLFAAYVASRWLHGGWWVVFALLAVWRWVEVSLWWVKLLLDRTHKNILAVERNLLFLAADVLGVVTASAVVWRSVRDDTRPVSWVEALATFTLNGPPAQANSGFSSVIAAWSPLTGLVLVGAGLALLIGIVGERVRERPGVYTGPTVAPRRTANDERPGRAS